ncbi:unnamed protein product [Paramecium sonneborni]|uniref:Uncharacterized protein n=1 Tax=Paramecium sonneborni TaxID=65129 RepID=A0A8S1QTW1_9CILI|nr:unnamed protein product [Paramecium sonneborni]
MEQNEEAQIIAARSLKGFKKLKEIIQFGLHCILFYQQKLTQAQRLVFQNFMLLIDYKNFSQPYRKLFFNQVNLRCLKGYNVYLLCQRMELKGQYQIGLVYYVPDSAHDIRQLISNLLLNILICNLSGELVEQFVINFIQKW